MSLGLQLGLALASVFCLVAMMAVIRRVATGLDWTAEIQRKLVHIATGLYAISLPWLFPDRWPVFVLVGLAILVLLLLRLPIFARGGLGEALHGVERTSYGDLLLALAIGVVFILADEPVLYVLPLAILTLSDAAAALTGSTYGRRFFTVEDGTKSLEGSAMFFLISFCLAMICLLALSDTPRLNVIYLGVIVALFGTLIEADSWRGFDNFFLPAGLMVFLQGHLLTPPFALFLVMAMFVIAIWLGLIFAPRFGLGRHLVRVYITAAFLVVTVVGTADAVLPVLVLLTHLVAQRLKPDSSAFPELDCVAALALMSFFWLVLGSVSGAYNLELYGLTALSMCISFAVLASGRWRALTGGLAVAGGMLLYIGLMAPPTTPNTLRVDTLTLAAGAILAMLLPVLCPDWFRQARAMRVASLAMLVPLIAFAFQYPTLPGGFIGGS